jgi:hypothetical protein
MSYSEHYQNYDWIKVKRHKYDPSLTWEENYKNLEQHHVKETMFLIEEVRKLAELLDVSGDTYCT